MTRRLDSMALIPDGMKAMAGVQSYLFTHSSLTPELIDLVYLRTSQINGCAYCIDKHSRDLLKRGMPVDKLLLVPVWHEAGVLFDARERAALAWTETVTRVAETAIPDADFAAVSEVFSPAEVADLTLTAALMNAYNRLGVGFRLVPDAAARAE